ncbi:MAG: hypothetical protein ISR77_30910 [Pirellulaceae bacterium]|nr:hypothetical protein [Pirellulaceae bacterium]
MFRKLAIAVVAIVVVYGEVTTRDVEAQRPKRPPLGDTIKKRLEAERKRRESEESATEAGQDSRLDDLRKAMKKRIQERSGDPQEKPSRMDDFREAVKRHLAEKDIEPQGEATTRRIDSGRVAGEIGADGLRELKKHGFVLRGHDANVPDIGRPGQVVIPDGPIDFSERFDVIKPILADVPDDQFGGRVKIETYRFRHVVLIKVTNLRTGRVTWIVRRRGSLFGSILAVVSRDAKNLDGKLDGIKGGGPWKTFLQLDKLAALDIPSADVPTEEEVPVETQTQLAETLKRFEQVRSNPEYTRITNLPEFQSTYKNLKTLTDSGGASAKPTELPAAGVPSKFKDIKVEHKDVKTGHKDVKPEHKDMKPGHKDVKPEHKDVKPGIKVELNFEENKPGI